MIGIPGRDALFALGDLPLGPASATQIRPMADLECRSVRDGLLVHNTSAVAT